MTLQVMAPALLELVDEDAELERLGTGFTFTEGPLWHPDGYLLFSDMPGDVRRRWDGETVEVTLNREGHRGTKGSADIHVEPRRADGPGRKGRRPRGAGHALRRQGLI